MDDFRISLYTLWHIYCSNMYERKKMTKRESQLIDYLNDNDLDAIKRRIELINQEINILDDERFYLMAKLFNLQNKQLIEKDM